MTRLRFATLGAVGSALVLAFVGMGPSRMQSAAGEPDAKRPAGAPKVAEAPGEIPEATASRAGARDGFSSAELARLNKSDPAAWAAKVKAIAERLQAEYPFESLRKRLAYESKAGGDAQASKAEAEVGDAASQRLEALERNRWVTGDNRRRALAMLHSESVENFIGQEGFGVSRMLPPAVRDLPLTEVEPIPFAQIEPRSAEGEKRSRLAVPKRFVTMRGLDETKVVRANPRQARQPSAAADALLSAPIDAERSLPAGDRLLMFHDRSELDFLNIRGLGYVRDLDHVAGFQSHQFRELPLLDQADAQIGPPQAGSDKPAPAPTDQWLVRRLELVSLLKHEKPGVYVSEHLPKMDELEEAQTRPLSTFEDGALAKLREGEELISEATTNEIYMVGALRASKQCLECHEVQRGALLGAFSYELCRKQPLKSAPKAKRPTT